MPGTDFLLVRSMKNSQYWCQYSLGANILLTGVYIQILYKNII